MSIFKSALVALALGFVTLTTVAPAQAGGYYNSYYSHYNSSYDYCYGY